MRRFTRLALVALPALALAGCATMNVYSYLERGVDFAQGFYVASPRGADELIDWLGVSWPAVA